MLSHGSGALLKLPCVGSGMYTPPRGNPEERQHSAQPSPGLQEAGMAGFGLTTGMCLSTASRSRRRISCTFTSKLVQWATEHACSFCIENQQFSYFWQTTFIQSVIHLMNSTTFQSCMYGSTRPKRTMLGFNAAEFAMIKKMCSGVSGTHKPICHSFTCRLNCLHNNVPTKSLPKGPQLLQVVPRLLPSSCLKRGIFVSEQQICEDGVNRIVSTCQAPGIDRQGTCETQVSGVPWSEDQCIEQMVRFGHPTTVKSGLPEVLQSTIKFYHETGVQERMQFRACTLGFRLRRLVELKDDERKLKASMDSEVAQILKDKNLLLWEEMLKSVDYPDMGVVDELRNGTDLVSNVEKTGLWPTKFQPALVTLDESCMTLQRENLRVCGNSLLVLGEPTSLIRFGTKLWKRSELEFWRDQTLRKTFPPLESQIRNTAGSEGEVH